jgi:hypothetical protein
MQHSKSINDGDSSVESGKLLKATGVLAVEKLVSHPSLPKRHLQLLKNLDHIGVQTGCTLNGSHSVHLLSKSRVECLSDLLRLTDTAALDDDVVKLLKLSHTYEFLQKITAEGAANTAILKSDNFLLGL